MYRGVRGKQGLGRLKEEPQGSSEGSPSEILSRKPVDIVESARKGGEFIANGGGERKKCKVVIKGLGMQEGTASVFLTDSETELYSES